MELFNRQIDLVIFDLDGTLIDSTSIWSEIDKEFFHSRGMEIPQKYAQEIAHVGLLEAAKITKKKYVPNESVEDIMKEWVDMSIKAYEETIPLKDGALELLETLKQNNIHIALATVNQYEIYNPCLSRLGIDKYFEYIIDPKDCQEGKNSAKIYDLVCEKVGVNKENALIIEDSLPSQKTAFQANYLVVGVYDKNSFKDLSQHELYTHKIVYNFKELIDLIKD